ncbi:MAG: helix-turn-helix transcriptional regulator [Bacilli bacterium]|nr:helix-turn-helix transcriptional regulator [Bacilli bacterium]
MESLKEYISRHRVNKKKADDFVTYLYELMEKYGFDKNSDLYDKANISRQYWSKLINKERQPSLETTLKIVFALKLTNQECKYLLKKAGYTLASSSTYALIIRYSIENKIYDLNKVNDLLEEHGFKAIE